VPARRRTARRGGPGRLRAPLAARRRARPAYGPAQRLRIPAVDQAATVDAPPHPARARRAGSGPQAGTTPDPRLTGARASTGRPPGSPPGDAWPAARFPAPSARPEAPRTVPGAGCPARRAPRPVPGTVCPARSAPRTVPGAVCPARSAPHGPRRRLPGPKRPARSPPPSLLLARGESALRSRGPTYKDGPDSLSAFFPQADLDPTVATTLAPCRSHRPAPNRPPEEHCHVQALRDPQGGRPGDDPGAGVARYRHPGGSDRLVPRPLPADGGDGGRGRGEQAPGRAHPRGREPGLPRLRVPGLRGH